jgi:hypothetical protein
MVTDKSQRKPQTRLAMALAPAWERLTGEKPTAFRVGENTEEGAGKFYRFVCAVCDLYEIDYPSVDAAREAYAPRVRRKSPST